MRLAMLTQDFPPAIGGIQTYALELAQALARRCDRFEVIAPGIPAAGRTDRALPFPVRRLPVSSDAVGPAALAALPLWAGRRRFDAVLHAQWYTLYAGLAARRLGLARRVFCAAHGRELLLHGALRPRPVFGAVERARNALLSRADGWFPVSRFTGSLLVGHGVDPARIHAVPNGVSPDRFRPADGAAFRRRRGLGSGPLVLTLARLVPRKGIDTVIRALPRVAAAVPDVTYAVAGSGPDLARLERLAADVGVAARVRFLGRIPEAELCECLSAGDVFVMPARSEPPDVEGFGLVFLEANACGRPVIGARAGAVAEAIRHDETGLLVEPDDPRGLAEAIAALLTDAERAARLGRQGRAWVEREGTWDRAADRMIGVMEGSVSCASSSP